MGKIIKAFLIGLFLLLVGGEKTQAKELPQVIFVNHIRGEECCDTGNIDHFKLQLTTFTEENIPTFFALRYDALTDPRYQEIIEEYANNDLVHFGIMLEVTPQFAKDAFVAYKDTPENWFKAQNAFLIGYTPEDRFRLIDTLVTAYRTLLGTYPEFSTAWQVDSVSLNYLQTEYGLKMHQIAREQWGLDSYTLDGGPPHYPYLASKNWPFIPDFSDTSHLLIIRHTLDDPLYSYGDNSSAFTSQPNDYVLDGKDFGYFERLLDQAMEQTQQPGFINLGLENSMAENHQQEYLRHIEKIKKFITEKKVSVVNSIESLKSLYQVEKITIHESTDLVHHTHNSAFWVTTPKYRLRIRFTGNRVLITDIRVYNPNLPDPYQNDPAQNQGYLIVPYLINDGISFPETQSPNKIQKLLGIPMINTFSIEPKKDVTIQQNYIELPPTTDLNSITIHSKNTLSYQSDNGLISFNFNQDTFEISNIDPHQLTFQQKNFPLNPLRFSKQANGGLITWEIAGQTSHMMDWVCQQQNCLFEFELNPHLFHEIREKQYPFIFPEKKPREIHAEKTITYVHNRYAIAGRNPVRIVLVPQDQYGFPTSSEKEVVVTTEPQASSIHVDSQSTSRAYQFIDIHQNTPQSTQVSIQLDSLSLAPQTIYFAPNCKKEIIYCALHPRQSWWFIRTIIEDKIRLKLLGEKQ